MTNTERNYADECGDHGGMSKQTGEPCGRPAGWGTSFDSGRCKFHAGVAPDGGTEGHGAPENNDNAVSHGLYQSEETFLANAPERHLDTYRTLLDSLCRRYEYEHGIKPYEHDEKELSHVAVEMTKIDMSLEYQAENAVDPTKPLTETQVRDVGGEAMEVEAASKVEQLKTHIRRENRLTLKEKNIYASPDAQQADATGDLAAVLEGIDRS